MRVKQQARSQARAGDTPMVYTLLIMVLINGTAVQLNETDHAYTDIDSCLVAAAQAHTDLMGKGRIIKTSCLPISSQQPPSDAWEDPAPDMPPAG